MMNSGLDFSWVMFGHGAPIFSRLGKSAVYRIYPSEAYSSKTSRSTPHKTYMWKTAEGCRNPKIFSKMSQTSQFLCGGPLKIAILTWESMGRPIGTVLPSMAAWPFAIDWNFDSIFGCFRSILYQNLEQTSFPNFWHIFKSKQTSMLCYRGQWRPQCA